MLFNSLDFAVFLPIVFTLYWLLQKPGIRYQNFFLVIASYVFYGWWDWRFLSLIFLSTLVDYGVSLQLGKTENPKRRRALLGISLAVNLGVLGFFKYSGFFIDNLIQAFTLLGQQLDIHTLRIILPVGISFYTFQTLSYTIDVYRRKLEPTSDFIAFSAFVSFFPQLVAGPIERATHLLPQFAKKREFSYPAAADGAKQILWGLFKKMVIADNAAKYINLIYADSTGFSGSTYVLATIFFAFQIYGDFSGYSDIAIGVARLFGFDLMTNFRFPYFARDVAEFWRRWHISLTTWFRDYVYIPLGGSRKSRWLSVRNTLIVFLVSGFWHGANWTFIFWGLLNAVYFLPLYLTNSNRRHLTVTAQDRLLPSFRELLAMAGTFGLVTFSWLFFRASSMSQAFTILKRIVSPSLFTIPQMVGNTEKITVVMIAFMLVVEWFGRHGEHALQKFLPQKLPQLLRWLYYAMIICCIGFFMAAGKVDFIYFQF